MIYETVVFLLAFILIACLTLLVAVLLPSVEDSPNPFDLCDDEHNLRAARCQCGRCPKN